MKINISNPATGCQKILELDDEKKLRAFFDKRMGSEMEGEVLGDEFKGYIFKISGGNDKQGFPMMQGVMTNGRVRLLLKKEHPCYRQRRTGERKRKSVRGCIVGPDLSVMNLVIVKKGDGELQGLTDKNIPRRLGPKRATRIRKLFNLEKADDVRKYVVRRECVREGKKTITKAPKIQRLITSARLQRKRAMRAEKIKRSITSKKEASEYHQIKVQRMKERKEKRSESRRRSSARRSSANEKTEDKAKPAAKTAAAPAKAAPAKAAPAKAAPAKAAPAKAAPAKAPAPAAAKPAAAKPAAAPAKKAAAPAPAPAKGKGKSK